MYKYIAIIIISLWITSCQTVTDNREEGNSLSIKPAQTEITETGEYIKEGVDLYREGKYREAISYYDNMLKLHPRDSIILVYKGVALAAIKKHAEAITCYDEALKLKPDSAKTWHYRGLALMQLNKTDEGIKSLQKAIEIDPSYMTVRDEFSLKPSELKVRPTDVPEPMAPVTPSYPPGSGVITRVEEK